MKTFLLILLLINVHSYNYGQNIVQAEYFIDTDKGFGNNTSVSVMPVSDGDFPFTVNLAGITKGTHLLFIRTKDSNGKWSLTARKSIEVLLTANKNTIVTGEYFFDTDPGFGAAAAIAISPQDSVIMQGFSAITTGLPAGYHKLYIRLKDDYNNWSLTARHNVEVIKDTTGGLVKMVEYFFDTDPGFGNCASVTFASPAKDSTFSFVIPANQIPANYANLYVRVKDSSNYNWSLTQWVTQKALPLTLLDFSVVKQNNIANLTWQTTNEVNASHFSVQRSTDAINFTTIGKVAAKGSIAKNDYKYADDITNIHDSKIFYRLQQADRDGKISYSKIVSITNTGNNRFSIMPNPARDFFSVTSNGGTETDNVSLIVTDLAGHTLIQQKLTNVNAKKINISNLAKGMYMVKIITAGTVQTQKLIVQ